MLCMTSVLNACLRSNCTKTFCSALRTLGFAAAVFGAGSFAVSGDARAAPILCTVDVNQPCFEGLAGGLFGITILGGSFIRPITSTDEVIIEANGQANATGVAQVFVPDPTAEIGPKYHTGISGGSAGGITTGSHYFAQAGAFGAAGFVLEPPVDRPGFVDFFAQLTDLTLTTIMEASVIFDFLLALTPAVEDLALQPRWGEGEYFDPRELFGPGQILFSCAASNLDPGGCNDLISLSRSFAAEFDGPSALVAVSTVQGMTRGELPARVLPVPAPPALALIGLGLLGLGGIRRIRSATGTRTMRTRRVTQSARRLRITTQAGSRRWITRRRPRLSPSRR